MGRDLIAFFDWANYMLVIVIGKYLSFFCLLVLSGDLLFRFLFERSFLLEITFFYSHFCLSISHLLISPRLISPFDSIMRLYTCQILSRFPL
jgi:hypothetical protein